MPLSSTDQKDLQAFLKRRHPLYDRMLAHWIFVEATYNGGRDWFEGNIFRYIKEGDKEFKDRLARAYRFNHSKEIVDLVQKYIFKSPVERNTKDASKEINAFWKKATLTGLDIDQYMRLIGAMSSIFGRIWIFTDTTKTNDLLTKADESKADARVYTYFVKPTDILDFSFDENGNYNWVLVRETYRDDVDPILTSGEVKERFRLWMKDEWYLFQITMSGRTKKVIVEIVDHNINPLNTVPCFHVDNVIGESKYAAHGLIDDIAYLDRATANYLSNLDAIIQDQTFSQLAMPAQSTLPGDEKYDHLIEMGTKRIFLYDGEGTGEPKYLSPDVKQAEIIVVVINKIINEIYHTVGMAGERTKQDNAVGIDNSSGVAKAYDFERLNSLLVTKSESLENCENKLTSFVHLWNEISPQGQRLVKYPDTFDVRSLFDEFTVAEHLGQMTAPDDVRREQMKQVIDKLFPALASDIKKKMLKNLEDWPSNLKEKISGGGEMMVASSKRNASTQNRQGQVTSET
jgi:hypothetical protein